MTKRKLLLLGLVPALIGYLHNLLVSATIDLPGFVTLLAYYLPIVLAIGFCLRLGHRCQLRGIPFWPALALTQWFSPVSLALYVWQFFLLDDKARSMFLAGLAQCASSPLMMPAARLTWLTVPDNVWDRMESLIATAISLALLAVLFSVGYFWSRRRRFAGSPAGGD